MTRLNPKIPPPSSPVCVRNAQAGKDRKGNQDLMIQPRTGDENHPDCSGEMIREPLELGALLCVLRVLCG
jgi:hypothetical protein